MNPSDCEYVYIRNHPQHLEFGRQCSAFESAAYPAWVGKSSSQLFRNLCSIFYSLGKPKRKVFILEGPGAIAAIWLRRTRHTRVLMINADPTLFRLDQDKGIKKIVSFLLLSKVDVFLSPANLMLEKAREHFPSKQHRIFHMYVDTQRWQALPPEKRSEDFLYIGRADRFKNQELTLHVFQAVKKKYSLSIRMTLVGYIAEDYQSTLAPLLDESVTITGWRKIPWENLPASGYYFNLAWLEPSGTNILEALALGLAPIVSTGCGYAQDVIAKIDTHLIVPLDEARVIEAWEYLRNLGPEARETLRLKCLQEATHWSRERAFATFKAVCEADAVG